MAIPDFPSFLHPVSLQFFDDALEQRFLAVHARNRSVYHDKLPLVLGLCSLFTTATAYLAHSIDSIQSCYTFLLLLYGATTLCMSQGASSKYRTAVVMSFRAVNSAIVSSSLRRNRLSDSANLAFIQHVFSVNGVFSLICEPFMFPVPLKYSLATQTFSLVTYSYNVSTKSCSLILSVNTGQAYIQHIWQYICRICYYAVFIGRIQVLDVATLMSIACQPHLACVSSTLLLQLVCGFVLPLLLLYSMEHKERIHFWAVDQNCCPDRVEAALKLSVASKLLVGAVLLLCLLGVWEAAVVLRYNHLLP